MKTLLKFIVLATVVAGWPLALSAVHVVRVPGQLPVVGSMVPSWGDVKLFTKEDLGFKSTFADTRAWSLEDVSQRRAFVARMQARGLDQALASAGTPDDIAAALRGEIKAKPAVVEPVPAAVPVLPPPPPVPSKTVELVKPPTAPPTSQPTAEKPKPTIFDF